MKVIMIAIKPSWCAKIMNGDKGIEIRKNKALYKATMKLIEEQGYATFLMYCSKSDKKNYHLIEVVDTDTGWEGYEYDYYIGSEGYLEHCLEGKVVAKFTVRKVEEIIHYNGLSYFTKYENKNGIFKSNCSELTKKSCLSIKEFNYYIGNHKGYAYHIEDLVIFDRPKELKEFWHYKKETNCGFCIIRSYSDEKHRKSRKLLVPLTKAPQNYCYVESEE